MPKESLRISAAMQQLLKRRANQQGLRLSTYMRKLIEKGLEAERHHHHEQETVSAHMLIEVLFLSRYLVSEKNPSMLEKIKHQVISTFQQLYPRKETTDGK